MMPTREELQEAYLAFRLPVGSDWRAIKKRYKLLVKAWHPDKQGGQVKEEVQQELKEYNHFYNDIFKVHFESEHSDALDCLCQPVHDVQQEAAQEQFQQQENQNYEPLEPVDPEIEARSQRRRWQASACFAVAFLAILAYGFVGGKIKSIMPAPKTETVNPSCVNPVPASQNPSSSSPSWRAQYQSISTPITQSQQAQQQPQPQPSAGRNVDDIRRDIVAKEGKMQLLQQSIDTLQSEIKMANQSSAGMLYRDLGAKEAEMKILQQDVYYLKMQLNQ